MEFYSNGCLSQYLSVHSVDWWTMCRMTHGVTLGESKVGVAHRDVSSRNILVRSDLSCVLSDFNLSISLKDTPCYHGDQHTLPIAEVRSVRYLSPEVLGGSVNLRDWGRALKKVDVYALGLMFWESFRRCSDLFTGSGSEGPQVFSPPELAAGLEGSNPAGPQSPGPEPQSADLTPRGRTNPRRAERPRSLDLSSPGLALDVPLSASAEKIKRRVKTPYTLKKWRPASWDVCELKQEDGDHVNVKDHIETTPQRVLLVLRCEILHHSHTPSDTKGFCEAPGSADHMESTSRSHGYPG
ncbi:bone morphogenetic protein receptor type-2-like [Gouania willdenowi]|uniref:bone morphogenetic protein receptor type-2-like n=1 Tax=Gouania willdenowi TaxID=441366 RepID=UPI001055CD39|nr:bone morphogenetic protein receptor type-2-like [Gouania willdenowi]